MTDTFTEGKRYGLEDLRQIIRILRSGQGCHWDREQTHTSLKECMREEAQEALDAIDIYARTGAWDNLCEELGDVLLQVVMHSVIAQEEGIFTLEDVIQGISEKMIRRHPRVFGGAEADSALSWEEIKERERG